MTALSKLGQAALAYARRGWHVFPCESCGKKPLTEHGLKDASVDAERIREWWTRWPRANIGHPTGAHVILDVDGREGESALAQIEKEHGALPGTLTAQTGKGRHLYFSPNGSPIRNSAGKLGPHLDVRGEGGYVILPPSIHASGVQYRWALKTKPVPLPSWIGVLLAEAERPRTPDSSEGERIPKGERNDRLARMAGAMRRKGMTQSAIESALLAENKLRCDPPLPDAEVKSISASVGRYAPVLKIENVNPWSEAEGLDKFLESGEDGADFLDPEKRILARAAVTEIFSPRGLGKSLYALWLALQLAGRKFRVLYVDRDNPRHVVRSRLRGFGAETTTPGLKIISREHCPPLTNAPAWALFPYADYDVVILDSFDSAAEGVGEQDSGKASRAIAPVLDIARRENGPAVLILGNTVRSAQHSRGSGVIEDRADIVYEVRDATELHPSGSKPWLEELPPADAGSWASRSSRRKRREVFRLAFAASKFRIGVEPESFILEIDLSTEPWTVADVTNDVDREGAETRDQRAKEKAARLDSAAEKLNAETLRRTEANEPPMRKRQDAEPFLAAFGLRRGEARDLLNDRDGTAWTLKPSLADKRIIHVLPPVKNGQDGHISTLTEAAQIKASDDTKCGRSISMHPATSDRQDTSQTCGFANPQNVAEAPIISPAGDTEVL